MQAWGGGSLEDARGAEGNGRLEDGRAVAGEVGTDEGASRGLLSERDCDGPELGVTVKDKAEGGSSLGQDGCSAECAADELGEGGILE